MIQDYPPKDEDTVSSFLFLFIVIKRLRILIMNTASDMHPTLFSNFVLIDSSACEYDGPKEPLCRYFSFCCHPKLNHFFLLDGDRNSFQSFYHTPFFSILFLAVTAVVIVDVRAGCDSIRMKKNILHFWGRFLNKLHKYRVIYQVYLFVLIWYTRCVDRAKVIVLYLHGVCVTPNF